MIASAGWLVWQARSHDRQVSSYRIAAAEVRNIGRLAEDWQAETARVWANAVAGLAELDIFAMRIAQHEANLADAVLGLPRLAPKLANDLSAYSNAIDARTERVARFKSNLEAVRTSVQRLPAHVAEVAEAADRSGQNTGIAEQIASLAAQLSTYAESPDEPAKVRLALALESLAAGIEWHAPALASAVTAFMADARTPLARRPSTNALFAAATSGEIYAFSDDLASTLESAWTDVARRGTRNQVLALGLAGTAPLLWLAAAMKRRAGGRGFAGALPSTRAAERSLGHGPQRGISRLPVARFGRRAAAARADAEAAEARTANGADANLKVDDVVADADSSDNTVGVTDVSDVADVTAAGSVAASQDRPSALDEREAHSLLRARLLVELVAEELAAIAGDLGDAAGRCRRKSKTHSASVRLGRLAKSLAAARWDQNTRYGALDVNQCVTEAIAIGTRCGFVTVVTQFAARPVTFAAEDEIVVLLANVIDNAVRAARRKHGNDGRIDIATTVDGGKATITIADNGAGLAAAVREQPFRPFHALEGEGLGVGLANAAALAKRNDTTISLRSTDDGTVARVVLPRHA